MRKIAITVDLVATIKKLVGDITNGYSYVDTDMAAKIEESKRRAKEMDILDAMKYPLFKTDYITNIIKDSMTIYNEMYIKKEDKKMDIKLYECGTFTGGVVTKPQDLIKNVIFSGPCTIVQWSDGDKTVVRCENENFDKEKGLAMAIVKKLFGTNESKSNYNDIFKKWIKEEKKEVEETKETVKDTTIYMSVKEYAKMTGMSRSTIIRHINEGKIFGAKKNNTGKWIIPVGDLGDLVE